MKRCTKNILWLAAAILATGITGCDALTKGTGTFDKNLTVTGPVNLEFENGSGRVRISAGPAGEVRVHAQFEARAWPWEDVSERVAEVEKNPPVTQQGNLIRIGEDIGSLSNLRFDYSVVVPEETEVRGSAGSGTIEVRGIRGPANLTAGSGEISAEKIGEDVQVAVGSGGIHLREVQGEAQATSGSGDIELRDIRGQIRARAGSGDISMDRPGGAVEAGSGSGDINITQASRDLRIHTGSGDVAVAGEPTPSSYWELHTSSGNAAVHVPPTASFRLYAHSSSGHIESGLPLIAEEKASKRDLRGRVGQGQARIEVETSSGAISLH